MAYSKTVKKSGVGFGTIVFMIALGMIAYSCGKSKATHTDLPTYSPPSASHNIGAREYSGPSDNFLPPKNHQYR
jgi:hypothetical protein